MTAITEATQRYVLTVSANSVRGQVAALSGFLEQHHCYISEFSQFDDPWARRFFARTVFRPDPDHPISPDRLRAGFEAVAAQFAMEWTLHDADRRCRVLIMVSKFDHCLNDLLYRQRIGELAMDVTAVVSNHPDLEAQVVGQGVRFLHLPLSAATKAAQEARLLEIIEETQSDLVVLARYMQVLSDELCARLRGRAINIHHSFLPGFKGARPYHQAFERGVKLIGATAHYVTADLDEGPIIEQVVERVGHTDGPEQMVSVGRDSEALALARAVKLHIEHRVFLNGNKTVLLP